MFFYAIYNSKLWRKKHNRGQFVYTNRESKSRFIKVLLTGSICYMIMRSLLYSDYMKDFFVQKYSKYFYGIIVLDAILFFNRYRRNVSLEKKNNKLIRNKMRHDKLTQQMLLSQMLYDQQMQQQKENINEVPVNISLENEIPTKIKSDNKEQCTSDISIEYALNDNFDIPIYTSKNNNNPP